MTNFTDVGHFHEKFGLNSANLKVGPQDVPEDWLLMRQKFMQEELDEFVEALSGDDIAGMADALVDLVYVAMGTAHLLGLPWDELWAEVQRCNMAKERATGADDPRSKRAHVIDIVKPAGWTPPDIAMILVEHGWPRKLLELPCDYHAIKNCTICGSPVDLGKRLLDEETGEGERRDVRL
jgi:predicted HAD superfamily Cof-like phosphohydrolase